MTFIVWRNEFSVNVKKVDEQHQHLLSLLNKLHEAVTKGLERSTLTEIFDELIDYTIYHFETEEKLFQTYGYPEYHAHKQEHDALTKQAVELQNEFSEGSATISYELLEFLRDWVVRHTLGSDKKFSAFLNDKGVF